MAFVKICDSCGKKLGGEDFFIQTRGSVSDQYEPGEGRVEFRYLMDKQEQHTFCDDECEMEWREKRRKERSFQSRI